MLIIVALFHLPRREGDNAGENNTDKYTAAGDYEELDDTCRNINSYYVAAAQFSEAHEDAVQYLSGEMGH